ncbi:hypothetical protein PLICRDRAFT_32601 [Plicaturopsis crispa FD-325 SS-3]|uniref:Uncharacterized protein n=1 Tax=Plicaturopsis crispa FD-325 SS-3 TaxID=944288 RepID=A0A0C9T4M8_PLICR|nr:hypothetical protein PLICRDRAFT_32601 [Plicaturopsis crispa FD-325 SS-3]
MRLARNTQRHLDALLVAFSLRHSQGVSTADIPTPASPRDPPPWAIMYGIFQKCDTVHIVAHLPSWDPSTHECHYHAILVDSLPFAPRTTSMQSPEQTLARLRVAIALLTIQKHCARLRAVWEDGLPGLAWPQAIVDYERALADEVTGIVSPMPSVETDVELDYIMFYDPWLDENEPFDTGADEEDMRRSRVIVKRWLRGKPVHQ